MFIKFVFLSIFVFIYVNCESESDLDSVTTIQSVYSVNQIDDDNLISNVDTKSQEGLTSRDEIIIFPPISSSASFDFSQSNHVENSNSNTTQVDEKIEIVPKAKEVNQVHINDLNGNNENLEVEAVTTIPEEITTIQHEVHRFKRAPRYTISELLAPNGIGHEIGHLRDHAVERIGKVVARSRIPGLSSRAARLSAIGRGRTQIHHKYHHIPNHLAYLPIVGGILDETNPNRIQLSALNQNRLFRNVRSPRRLPKRLGRVGSIFRRAGIRRRVGRRIRRIL